METMKNVQCLVLDFDGTIGDSTALIVRTMQATMRELGLPVKDAATCSTTIGLPLAKCFSTILPLTEEEAEHCATVYRRIFAEGNTPDAVKPFPHVLATLRRLHEQGITMAIASSRGHETLDGYVHGMGLTDIVSMVVGADDVVKAKPDPEPVLIVLRQLGFTAEETVVVGDMAYDVLMGRNAGCRTAGVTYGNGTREELQDAGADAVVDDFQELNGIIKKALLHD